jgi:hypothetical protein
MAFHTVLTPPPSVATGRDALEKTLFLKDGFVVTAFLFTGLWLLAKRLWLAFAVFALVYAGVIALGRVVGVNPLAIGVAQLLIGLYLGLEGHALLERKLVRKGWRVAGVVEGRDRDQMERRFFETVQLQAAPSVAPVAAHMAAPVAAVSTPSAPGGPTPILGLFPDAARR